MSQTLRLTHEAEERFFEMVYKAVDDGFRKWEEENAGKDLTFETYEEQVIDLPTLCDHRVTFGRRPDNGFWRGYIDMACGSSIVTLKMLNKTVLGVLIGGIKDFDCLGGADLFAWQDRFMYYADRDGSCERDDDTGLLRFVAYGPYQIKALGGRNVLDPQPTTHCPEEWVASLSYRTETTDLIDLELEKEQS
jgi:hypothetical protein